MALAVIGREYVDHDVVVDWYGQTPMLTRATNSRMYDRRRANYYRLVMRTIDDLSLNGRFRLHPPCRDVVPLYHGADVVCMPSFFEGCSNVICEAMACGVPVLASRVSDNVRLVVEGRNGFLFDPSSPHDMANAIIRFAALSASRRRNMGLVGRKMAEIMLSADGYIDRYVDLIRHLVLNKQVTR